MRSPRTSLSLAAYATLLISSGVRAETSVEHVLGVACASSPPRQWASNPCPTNLLKDSGNAVEPKTGRRFFLDFPRNLKSHEKVTFVLALHGGGFSGDWMRRYFPAVDFKDKYRLVIATPTGTHNEWVSASDDAYLKNIVEEIEGSAGKRNIKSFWLVGHSLGGQTANRLIVDDPFFSSRVTGWVSLSGGRLGSKREEVRAPIPSGSVGPPPLSQTIRTIADASILPDRPFSFIYATGEHELTTAGLPASSRWAVKLGCQPQPQTVSVVDASAGSVYDRRPQTRHNPIWGMEARPGSAQVYVYSGCADERIVADIIRLDKGHTEGLEPKITEEIVKLMTRPRA